MTKSIVWMCAAVCLNAAAARAQTARPADETPFFLDVNGGVQLLHHTVDSTVSFPLYDESAVFTGSQTTAHGAFIDVGIGYRFQPSIGVGLSLSNFTSKADATVVAKIPSPVFYDQPLTVNSTATGLTRTERAVHFRVFGFLPVTDRFEVALSAGPSLVKLSQEVPSGTVAPGTQNVTIVPSLDSKTGIGFNAGFDGTYALNPHVGIAVLAHYVFASLDLNSASGVHAGGLQTGIGLHFRF